ncbi:T9SS type A sorting domain-containing protein [Candidatus Poribacteria bacterium]|nr:T9SS type A sorting domain-containing protein [Candidatus Poribacteria bacterium]
MKKLCLSIFLTLFLGFHPSSIDVLAQSCTQLSLPEHAIARLCTPRDRRFEDLDYSPDGKTLASITQPPRQVVLWDIENKIVKLTIDDVNGQSVRYSPDGKTLVCGNKLYDATTGQPKLILSDSEGYENHVIYSPDGKTLAGAGPKGIRFWSSNVDEPTADALPVGERPIDVLPTDPSVGDTPEVITLTPIATSSTTVPIIQSIAYSPDGKELAVGSFLGVWIYNTELNTEKALLTKKDGGHIDHAHSVVYSPDGNTLASGGGGDICLWDTKTKKLKFKIDRTSISYLGLGAVPALDFSPDGNIFVSGDNSGDSIHLWDTETAEYKYTLTNYQIDIQSLAFSPDGKTIASGNSDKTILLYDFTSYPIVSISPDSVLSLTVSEELTFDLKITNGKDVSGYQATIVFDPDALTYQETEYADYLSEGVPVQPIVNQHSGTVQLAALSLSGIGSNGDGTLATLKFKVNAIKGSKLSLRDVILSNNEGNKSYAWIEGTQLLNSAIAEGCATFNIKDVNKDCVINIQDLVLVATHFGRGGENVADVNGDGRVDIIDLVLVAGAFGDTAASPAVYTDTQAMITTADVQQWLHEAHKVNLTDSMYQRGMVMLEQLLTVLPPKNTALLPNYPNPFNPETWIPYQLEKSAEVIVFIYSANGTLIRKLALGYQSAGIYRSRDRAAYWDGRNEMGEPVASGVYFYTLSTGSFNGTRKMLVVK